MEKLPFPPPTARGLHVKHVKYSTLSLLTALPSSPQSQTPPLCQLRCSCHCRVWGKRVCRNKRGLLTVCSTHPHTQSPKTLAWITDKDNMLHKINTWARTDVSAAQWDGWTGTTWKNKSAIMDRTFKIIQFNCFLHIQISPSFDFEPVRASTHGLPQPVSD